jgi:hypothetical protein
VSRRLFRRAATLALAVGAALGLAAATEGVASASTQASFTCSVTYPYVTDDYTTGHISWSAAVGCSIVLRMQGTTVLFPWGSNSAYAYGSSYDNYSSYNTSTGGIYGIHNGLWGVNNNVLIFIPAGYTTTLGAGCYYVNSSQIHCTATTGPITAH